MRDGEKYGDEQKFTHVWHLDYDVAPARWPGGDDPRNPLPVPFEIPDELPTVAQGHAAGLLFPKYEIHHYGAGFHCDQVLVAHALLSLTAVSESEKAATASCFDFNLRLVAIFQPLKFLTLEGRTGL